MSPEGLCRGCYRTLAEIADWQRLNAAAQWAIVRECSARRAAAEPALRALGA